MKLKRSKLNLGFFFCQLSKTDERKPLSEEESGAKHHDIIKNAKRANRKSRRFF